MGKVIGRGGTMIARLREEFERDVRVIQYDDAPELFVTNALKPAKIQKATVEKLDGRKVLQLFVSSDREKGRAVGRHGRNINRARLLVRRYFGIQDILIAVMADSINAETEEQKEAIASNTEGSLNIDGLQQMELLMAKNPTHYPGP
jgi:NusA-like KH domain protein